MAQSPRKILFVFVSSAFFLLQLLGSIHGFKPIVAPRSVASHAKDAIWRLASTRNSVQEPREFFELKRGVMEFGTVDVVELTMFETHDKVQSYILESPDRVVMATWDEDLVDRKAGNIFRLTTRPMQFVTLNFQPSIDVKVFHNEEDHLIVESQDCSISGLEQILGNGFASSLKVEVKGKLKAVPVMKGKVRLIGEVVFFTSGKLPTILAFTPKPILQTAAIAINRRIMSYAKGKFMENLAADFERWCDQQPVVLIKKDNSSSSS